LSIDNPLPITANMQNTLEIIGSVKGINGYSGNLTFAAVPEASTWAMAVLGFGAIGAGLRTRKSTKVAFA